MAEAKQLTTWGGMEVNGLKETFKNPIQSMQIDNVCNSLRRTISAPSVKGGEMDEDRSVFIEMGENVNTTREENNFDANKTCDVIQRGRSRTCSVGSQATPLLLNVDCSSTSPSPVRKIYLCLLTKLYCMKVHFCCCFLALYIIAREAAS